jgi:hypothetical protein
MHFDFSYVAYLHFNTEWGLLSIDLWLCCFADRRECMCTCVACGCRVCTLIAVVWSYMYVKQHQTIRSHTCYIATVNVLASALPYAYVCNWSLGGPPTITLVTGTATVWSLVWVLCEHPLINNWAQVALPITR